MSTAALPPRNRAAPGAPPVGPGERLIRLAYRAGLPGPALANPFRKPARPRLLAVVESPLAGDRAAGMALRTGHLLVHGRSVPVAEIGFAGGNLAPPLARSVHGFAWLRDLATCGAHPDCPPVAQAMLARWLDANPRSGKGGGWTVELAGLRLLAWLVHAPLILESDPLRPRALEAMAATARWLDRAIAPGPLFSSGADRLSELAGWCGIIAAGRLLPDGKPRRLFGEAGLARALGELVNEDGGVLSRSPLAQMDAIALLVDLRACYAAARRPAPDAVDGMLALLVPPLLALLHGDGALGNWQGAGAVSAWQIAALVEASGVRARPPLEAGHWGYQRLASRGCVLQMDAAPPPLAVHARHGCASTLAFEFSAGPHRLIVNCGGAGFSGGLLPPEIAEALRATAAHSTLTVNDVNSTAVLPGGKLGRGVGTVEIERKTFELEKGALATRIAASHDGYVARHALRHQRVLTLRKDGSALWGEDTLLPRGRKRGKAVTFAVRFHLGPDVEPSLSDDGALLMVPDAAPWAFSCEGGTLSIEESLWTDGAGAPHPTRQLVIAGTTFPGESRISWALTKKRNTT